MIRVKSILYFLWVTLFLLLRPSMLAEFYNLELFFMFFVVSLAILVIVGKGRLTNHSKNYYLVLTVIFITILYFFVQGLVLSNSSTTVINSSFFIAGIVLCFALVSNKKSNHELIEYFINIHVFMSISIIITFIILIILSFETSKLPIITDFQLPSYDSKHLLFYPFSAAWSRFNEMGLSLPRFVGIYKEPGLAQVYFLTAFFFSLKRVGKYSNLISIVLLVGTSLLFSAFALISFFGGLLFYLSIKYNFNPLKYLMKNPFRFISVIVLFVLLFGFIEDQFRKKMEGSSGKDRVESFEVSYNRLSENYIFGSGYYSTRTSEGQSELAVQSLGLIGVAYQLGLVGLVLYIGSWVIGIFGLGGYKSFYIYIPCLLTLLFSQPSYNDPLVWFLILFESNSN